ncbi:unnamed protein product [Rangifer tarandus platyrhynchus]|uniref:Uncharacterized protein n=2 Tax=Rangifer tarandus platyrhynchus TaxID=3082113 RepID=A0ACB0F404_RANTA|nr:unnamed protein product [Rangifer tarandus platyrhynchus]CAI9706846.1 unnamed protein product [Rangifer tarandus platyrhynchus]
MVSTSPGECPSDHCRSSYTAAPQEAAPRPAVLHHLTHFSAAGRREQYSPNPMAPACLTCPPQLPHQPLDEAGRAAGPREGNALIWLFLVPVTGERVGAGPRGEQQRAGPPSLPCAHPRPSSTHLECSTGPGLAPPSAPPPPGCQAIFVILLGASLGEALEPVRTCRLLPQPYRSESYMSSPPRSGAIHAARIRRSGSTKPLTCWLRPQRTHRPREAGRIHSQLGAFSPELHGSLTHSHRHPHRRSCAPEASTLLTSIHLTGECWQLTALNFTSRCSVNSCALRLPRNISEGKYCGE